MKGLWIGVFLICLSGHAVAQSVIANEQASCNASFHQNCEPDQSTVASSTGFAAPIGVLGSSGLEGGLLALLIAGGIGRRLHRHVTGRGRAR